MNLNEKNILVGVSGGIAAYKSAELIRLLTKAKARVKVVMTPNAARFITPLTLHTLSGATVGTDLFEHETPMAHIELARWAELVLVAPATANQMAHLAHGFAHSLLDTLCLATQAPIILAPAMNGIMWSHPATQNNLKILRARGVVCWGPDDGEQACGETGEGRMLAPEALVEQLQTLDSENTLRGKKVLITAGPTQEPIDPVRFISNHSSGKMGYALAQAAHHVGAEVHLISGPVQLATPHGAQCTRVITAEDMLQAVLLSVPTCDIMIACAAVSDYRPSVTAPHKIKKSPHSHPLELTPTKDILKHLIGLKNKPYTVGFAAETENIEAYADGKRIDKQLDLIIANQVGTPGQGFGGDANSAVVLGEDFRHVLPLQSKLDLAHAIISIIATRIDSATGSS